MRCMAEGVPFDESEKPGYDQVIKLVVEPQLRSVAEIMQNNDPLGSRVA
jgi:hypothetical protein